MTKQSEKLWENANSSTTNIECFRALANLTYGLELKTYHDLWKWSTEQINDFWMLLWRYTQVVAQVEPSFAIALSQSKQLHPPPVWFPEARLNFAQNILESRLAPTAGNDIVLTEIREGGIEITDYAISELRARTAKMASALFRSGIKKGDRVACIGVNDVDTFVVFLGAATIGAIFVSCSPDTGEKAILDRLVQVNPRILFSSDAQLYNDKRIEHLEKVANIAKQLESLGPLDTVVIMPRFDRTTLPESYSKLVLLRDFLDKGSQSIKFSSLPFNHPLLIVFSSGTTGQPKCLVHSIGGVLVKQKAEQILSADMDQSSVLMQYTTTNWIMYLYSISALLSGARTILYDGSPLKPTAAGFMNLLAEQKVTHFGTSAHYLHLLEQQGVKKNDFNELDRLKVITSTGSVLNEGQFHWVYKVFGQVQLSSIAGGTDIAGAFVGGAPNIPVYAGWCQARALGMKVQIFSDSGTAIEQSGQAGELVCTAPFPSQPITFWNDEDGERYRSAYYDQFPGVWTQGDLIRMDPSTYGIQFLGRSDGVLNPGGIRFGSAEIYNCMTAFKSIEESLCVGQHRPTDSTERVLLFVKMKVGCTLDQDLEASIRKHIKKQLSPRHVPTYIFETPEIPMTINGKKTEIPVKKIVSGQLIVPSSTLMNPASLKWFERFAALPHGSTRARGHKL